MRLSDPENIISHQGLGSASPGRSEESDFPDPADGDDFVTDVGALEPQIVVDALLPPPGLVSAGAMAQGDGERNGLMAGGAACRLHVRQLASPDNSDIRGGDSVSRRPLGRL